MYICIYIYIYVCVCIYVYMFSYMQVLTKDKGIRWQRLEGLLGSAASTGAAGVSSWDMSRTGQVGYINICM